MFAIGILEHWKQEDKPRAGCVRSCALEFDRGIRSLVLSAWVSCCDSLRCTHLYREHYQLLVARYLVRSGDVPAAVGAGVLPLSVGDPGRKSPAPAGWIVTADQGNDPPQDGRGLSQA